MKINHITNVMPKTLINNSQKRNNSVSLSAQTNSQNQNFGAKVIFDPKSFPILKSKQNELAEIMATFYKGIKVEIFPYTPSDAYSKRNNLIARYIVSVDDEDETAKAINLKDKTQENYTGLIRGYVLESPTYFLPQKLSEGISDFLNEFFGERILYARSSQTAGKKLEEINLIFAAINAAPDCIEKLNNFATEQIAKKSKNNLKN